MTDRELLELAAKASGIEVVFFNISKDEFVCWHKQAIRNVAQPEWNPLTDDGDAFRLAIKMELFDLDKALVEMDCAHGKSFLPDDPYAATRRAIVCAVAKSGASHD